MATQELDALVRREHSNPHAVLGPHPADGGVVVRALRPAACAITAHLDDGTAVELEQIHAGGVFEGAIEAVRRAAALPARGRLRLRRDVHDRGSVRVRAHDRRARPAPDGEGRHEEIYEKLGAHVREHRGPSPGTAFAVWAPAARAVSVVGDFNSWDGRLHAMRVLGSAGIWELFLPGVDPGARYKFEILGADGELKLKADPYAQETEQPPKTASVVSQPTHAGQDDRWLARARAAAAAGRADLDLRGPPRLLAAEHARGQPPADLPRAGRRARRPTPRTWASPISSCCR